MLKKVFQKHFPAGIINKVSLKQVPSVALEELEKKSREFVRPEDYGPGNFAQVYVFNHDCGERTWIATQIKTYSGNAGTEVLTYFVDISVYGELIGYSELRLNIFDTREYFKDKPFVGMTKTEEAFLRKGYSLRRLRMMHAYAQAAWGMSLHSDTLLTGQAKGCWEKLELQKQAVRFKEGKHDRFQMLKAA